MRTFLVGLAACGVPLSAAAQNPSKVYISADMEGVAGISATDDPLGRRLMTDEVNAAIAGAFAAGATTVVVNDAHGGHDNLLQDRLDSRVTLLRGDLKPYGMMQGLDSTFSAVIFIGYHEKAGGAGFAAHTGSGRTADLVINGQSVGEGGMNALYAAWYGVPVVFASGDSLAIVELQGVVPGMVGVAVKSSVWGEAVHTLLPDSATAAIERGVRASLVSRRARTVPDIGSPVRVEYTYQDRLYANVAMGIPWLERVDARTVAYTVDDYPAAYRLIRVLYKHLRP